MNKPTFNPAQMLADATEAMRDPFFELDANEAAAVIAAFNVARTNGLKLDAFTIALIDVLKRQLAETFDCVDDYQNSYKPNPR